MIPVGFIYLTTCLLNNKIGRKLINNGIINRWIHPGEILPDGFVYGKIKK